MVSTSVYAINQADPPKWTAGELEATSAFVGMALWLAVDVLFCVNRVFKKKNGLYFWSITLGMTFIIVESIGDILKYLTPGSERIWPAYATLMLTGWAVYPQCQLLVLYSRLHLVSDVQWIRKTILCLIVAIEFVGVVPTWVVQWHSYNPNPKINKLWSPRTAIVERYNQVIVILVEIFISATYIYSLLKILKHKAGVRQKRVMHDLINTNILVISLDAVTVTLYYINLVGISHAVQVFTYALKLKIEFLVLNQLMIVAARGVRKKAWEEKRYLDPEEKTSFSAQVHKWASKSSAFEASPSQRRRRRSLDTGVSVDFDPSLARALPATDSPNPKLVNHYTTSESRLPQFEPSVDTPRTPPRAYDALSSASVEEAIVPQDKRHPSQSSSTWPLAAEDRSPSPRGSTRPYPRPQNHTPYGQAIQQQTNGPSKDTLDLPQSHTAHQKSKHLGNSYNEDDGDEIEFHMWERRGTVLLYAPWMKRPVGVEKTEGLAV